MISFNPIGQYVTPKPWPRAKWL